LKRRHLKPKGIIYIGKESNKIQENLIHKEKQEIYSNTKGVYQKILDTSNEEAENRGVSRPTLWKIQQKIKKGKRPNMKTRSVKKLISQKYFSNSSFN
jgi:hypothetical protein